MSLVGVGLTPPAYDFGSDVTEVRLYLLLDPTLANAAAVGEAASYYAGASVATISVACTVDDQTVRVQRTIALQASQAQSLPWLLVVGASLFMSTLVIIGLSKWGLKDKDCDYLSLVFLSLSAYLCLMSSLIFSF